MKKEPKPRGNAVYIPTPTYQQLTELKEKRGSTFVGMIVRIVAAEYNRVFRRKNNAENN